MFYVFSSQCYGLPRWLSGKKNLPASGGDARDAGLIPVFGGFPGGGNGNSLQYSCLGNSMDRRAWWATVHRVAKSQDMTEHAYTALHNAKAHSLCLVGRQEIFFDWLVVSLSKNRPQT